MTDQRHDQSNFYYIQHSWRWLRLLALLLVLASSNAIASEDDKQFVTVNIQEVLLGSSAGQSVKKVLEEKVLEFQKKFQPANKP